MQLATTHIDGLQGMGGKARCFKLTTPIALPGGEFEYINIWITPPTASQNAQVHVLPAHEFGSCIHMQSAAGLTVLADYDPENTEYVHGLYWLTLRMLGYDYVKPEDFPANKDDEAGYDTND